MSVHVVVLAGGAGTRFWPMGRRSVPKQLLAIASEKTMLEETLRRADQLASPDHTWVITNTEQAEATRKVCAGLPAAQVVAEPSMRNTAAAIGFASLLVAREDPDAVLVVLSADHVIDPPESFARVFSAAVRRAEQAEVLLTVGIEPRGPATGYGYIEAGEERARLDGIGVFAVKSFREKPDAATARAFLEKGGYFWNAGMFVWRVSVLSEAFRKHLPGHAAVLQEIERRLSGGTAPPELYERFEKVPIDIGVLEKAKNVEVLPADFVWDDVGSWLAIERLRKRDEHGNTASALHAGVETTGCILVSDDPDHLVATLGLRDLVVVHTRDVTLVCPKERAEEVRRLVDAVGREGLSRYL